MDLFSSKSMRCHDNSEDQVLSVMQVAISGAMPWGCAGSLLTQHRTYPAPSPAAVAVRGARPPKPFGPAAPLASLAAQMRGVSGGKGQWQFCRLLRRRRGSAAV